MLSLPDQIAVSLGIKTANVLALMSEVEKGLPAAALERLAASIAPGDAQFVYRIIPRATLARRRAGAAAWRLSAAESAKLARLAGVWALACDVWGAPPAARRFMFEAHALLEFRPPIDVVLESEFGRPLVEGILGRLKYGTAV